MSARTVAPEPRSRRLWQGAAIETKNDSGRKAAKRKPSYRMFGQAAGNAISLSPVRLARNGGADAPMEPGSTNPSHDWFHKNSSNPAVEPVGPVRPVRPFAHARGSEAQETTAVADINWRPLGELVCGIIERLAEANDFRRAEPDLADLHVTREFDRFHRLGARVLREQRGDWRETTDREANRGESSATSQRLDPAARASAT
jgi:hypothetical protein